MPTPYTLTNADPAHVLDSVPLGLDRTEESKVWHAGIKAVLPEGHPWLVRPGRIAITFLTESDAWAYRWAVRDYVVSESMGGPVEWTLIRSIEAAKQFNVTLILCDYRARILDVWNSTQAGPQ